MKKITFIFLLFFWATICEAQENHRVYQRFVGLGNCCVTRTQINHHLSKRFGKNPEDFGGGQLFDWLVIHDYNKLALAIENNLRDLFERPDLVVGPTWGGDAQKYRRVRNVKYAMTWYHLFSKKPDDTIDEHIIDLEYAICKKKIDYLSKKFKALAEYPTLYIIAYPFASKDEVNAIEPNRLDLVRLRNALEKLRGNRNFDILYCPHVKKFEDFENIYVRKISTPANGYPHIGDYDCWDTMLSQFPFSLEKKNTQK